MTVMRNNYLGNPYIAIEVNDYNLNKCKNNFKKNDREILIKQDVTCGLPILDNSVDVVTCNFLLEHLPKDKSFFMFKELVRVCKKHGLILICMPYRKNKDNKNGEEKHIYEWTKEDIYKQVKINNVSIEEFYLAGAKLQDLKKDNKLKEIINSLQGKINPIFIRMVLSPLSAGEGRDVYCKIRKGNLCL